MTRREFLRQLAVLAGTTSLIVDPEPWERLLRALKHPSSTDPQTVDHLEQMTVALLHSYLDTSSPSIRPGAVRGQAAGHLEHISELLNGSLQPALRQRLCSLAGETTALLGWLHWNLDDLDNAANYFRTGLKAATEANDHALGAYLVGSLACRPFYQENPDQRLHLLDGRTFNFTASDATPNTHAWLANLVAGGHALRGDFKRFAIASDTARELLYRADANSDRQRPRLTFFDDAYFAEEQAACFLHLNRPADAQAVLQDALPNAQGRIRLWMLVDLATAFVRDHRPEQAALTGDEAFIGAWNAGVEPVLRCVHELSADLHPYQQLDAVQQLRERIQSHSS
jgi:hypothetical protein